MAFLLPFEGRLPRYGYAGLEDRLDASASDPRSTRDAMRSPAAARAAMSGEVAEPFGACCGRVGKPKANSRPLTVET
jgi:hypothetical protein